MTEREQSGRDESARDPGVRLKRLLCRRTGDMIEPREHERCPYCFGRLAEIQRGRHEAFCDYREGVDPLNFGFPPDDSRFEQG